MVICDYCGRELGILPENIIVTPYGFYCNETCAGFNVVIFADGSRIDLV